MSIFNYWLANFLKFNSWLQWTSISWFCHNTKSRYYTPYFTDERTVQEDYFAPDYRQQVKKPGEPKILTIFWEYWVFRSGLLEGCELPAWLRYGFLFMVTWKIHTVDMYTLRKLTISYLSKGCVPVSKIWPDKRFSYMSEF